MEDAVRLLILAWSLIATVSTLAIIHALIEQHVDNKRAPKP